MRGEPQSMHEKRAGLPQHPSDEPAAFSPIASGGRSAEKPTEPRVLSKKDLAVEVAASSPWWETAGRWEAGG